MTARPSDANIDKSGQGNNGHSRSSQGPSSQLSTRLWRKERRSGRWWLDDRSWDWFWVSTLTGLGLVMFLWGLGGVPLRDWDEGIVAQVARNIWRVWQSGEDTWLYPVLNGKPYFNKPPLVHWGIAALYQFFGVNEWTSRLPGALCGAMSVPLLYGLGRQVFRVRSPAVLSALVYLTWFPLVRHGRLAMLDMALTLFWMAAWFCVVRSRRDWRWSLALGLALGTLSMTKGIVALLLLILAVAFLAWDTPRLLRLPLFWLGILLGWLPAIAWYGLQFDHYGMAFIDQNLVSQSFQRVWDSVNKRGGPPWYYLLELVKYSWPWLLLLPAAGAIAWKNRTWAWAKLVLVWAGGYGLVISIMGTKLPWYILPIYPALALMVGNYCRVFWQPTSVLGLDLRSPPKTNQFFPRWWAIILALLAVGAFCGTIYFIGFATDWDWALTIALGCLALTFGVMAREVWERSPRFLAVGLWGLYISFLCFFNSPQWLWELGEQYDVMPVAELIQMSGGTGKKIYTSYPTLRPSLNFYCDCQVVVASEEQLKAEWKHLKEPLFLLNGDLARAYQNQGGRWLGMRQNLVLVGKSEQVWPDAVNESPGIAL